MIKFLQMFVLAYQTNQNTVNIGLFCSSKTHCIVHFTMTVDDQIWFTFRLDCLMWGEGAVTVGHPASQLESCNFKRIKDTDITIHTDTHHMCTDTRMQIKCHNP